MEVVAYNRDVVIQSTNRDVVILTENPNRLYMAGIYNHFHTNQIIQNATQTQSILSRPFAFTFLATFPSLINLYLILQRLLSMSTRTIHTQ